MVLTEQQKAENKAANRVRDKAHSARCRAMELAVEASEADPEVTEARTMYKTSDEACTATRERRDEHIRVIEGEIAALQAQIAVLREDLEIDSLNEQRRSAATAWHAVKNAKVSEAEGKFPDLAGHARFSAACWMPPQEVLDGMEAARRTASPGATQKKTTSGPLKGQAAGSVGVA